MSGPQLDSVDYRALLGLEGRTFVVMGSGPGLGMHAALALANVGATVVSVDRDASAAEAVANATGGVAIHCDVTDRAGVEAMFTEAERAAGPVTGVVDVAADAVFGPLWDQDDAGWERTYDGVVKHAFLALQVGGRAIAKAGGGSMVFIGSNSGIAVTKGQSIYGSAKAALHHLIRYMGPELAPVGVRVNAIAPSFMRQSGIETLLTQEQWNEVSRLIPLGAGAALPQVAGPILFLASELASHITGQVLLVDGGLSQIMRLPELPWNTFEVTRP